MKRRLFLLGSLGLIAGCATAPASVPVEPLAVPPPSTPPPPVPPTPPDMASFLTGPDPVLTPTGDPAFDAYVAKVLEEGGSGWRPYLLRVLNGVRPDRRLLDTYNAERAAWVSAVPAYLSALITPARIAEGRRQVSTNMTLNRIARERNVPVEVIAAYWGAASDYGRQKGEFDLITALASLGAHGQGPPWWHWDIYHATQMIASGMVRREDARSFADGSMGQLRWRPDWYLKWAADGDGDGRIDIWRSGPDVIASIGALLARGWEAGKPWVYEVREPYTDPNNPYDARRMRGNSYRLQDLRRVDGRPWKPEEAGEFVQLLRPDSAPGRIFAIGHNFHPLAYSSGTIPMNETTEQEVWGLGVGLLAHRIREG